MSEWMALGEVANDCGEKGNGKENVQIAKKFVVETLPDLPGQ
jgi:hypothetical protein